MCTHCQIAEWLIEFKPLLNKFGVDVDHHRLWLLDSDRSSAFIEWAGHPDDGMWRENTDALGNKHRNSIPIGVATHGNHHIVEVHHENIPIPQLTIQYPAKENEERGISDYTFGVISISLNDLSVRYFIERCGVAKEIKAGDLPRG